MFESKNMKNINSKVDRTKEYALNDAVKLVKNMKSQAQIMWVKNI